MTDLVKDAFKVMVCDPFECELFERYLREVQESSSCGVLLPSSANVISTTSRQRKPFTADYGGSFKKWAVNTDAGCLNPLKQLTELLITTVISKRLSESSFSLNKICSDSSVVDPLCCPICEDVLRYPVTATCGHTFCRQCCFGHSKCTVCHQKFPTISSSPLGTALTSAPSSTTTLTLLSMTAPSTATSSSSSSSSSLPSTMVPKHDNKLGPGPDTGTVEEELDPVGVAEGCVIGFEQDILVRRLAERWWGPELKAAEFNEEAQRHLENNALDEALRCCNQSLEHDLLGKIVRAQTHSPGKVERTCQVITEWVVAVAIDKGVL